VRFYFEWQFNFSDNFEIEAFFLRMALLLDEDNE